MKLQVIGIIFHEVTKLRAEISRIKETVDQREANYVGKTEGKKAKLPKFLWIC